jgi:hypothetical protein
MKKPLFVLILCSSVLGSLFAASSHLLRQTLGPKFKFGAQVALQGFYSECTGTVFAASETFTSYTYSVQIACPEASNYYNRDYKQSELVLKEKK